MSEFESKNLAEEAAKPTAQQSREIPKQKHPTPPPPHTTEHQKLVSRINGHEYEIKFGPQPGGKVPANPFASLAQEGYMHAHPEILGKKGLAEWDSATKGKSLPKHVKKAKK